MRLAFEVDVSRWAGTCKMAVNVRPQWYTMCSLRQAVMVR